MIERAYMACHIIQAIVKPGEHLREFLAPNKVSCTWSIEPPGDWLQKIVILQVFLYAICQLRHSALFLEYALALGLKSSCLALDPLERVR